MRVFHLLGTKEVKHGDTEARRGKGEVIQLINRINFYNNSTRIGTDATDFI